MVYSESSLTNPSGILKGLPLGILTVSSERSKDTVRILLCLGGGWGREELGDSSPCLGVTEEYSDKSLRNLKVNRVIFIGCYYYDYLRILKGIFRFSKQDW